MTNTAPYLHVYAPNAIITPCVDAYAKQTVRVVSEQSVT